MKDKNIAVFDTAPESCAATADAVAAHYRACGQKARVRAYTSAYPLVCDFEKVPFDMAFLAINNPLQLDTARKVGGIAPACPLFFVCETEDYGLEAHRLMALDYLLKPLSQQDVARAVARINTPFGHSRHREARGGPTGE